MISAQSICTKASTKHFVRCTPISVSFSPLFCCNLSISLHLHSSSFSPRVQAVAKKRRREPVCVLDMLSFCIFFSTPCDEFRTFSVGNVRENQSLPPSSTSFYSISLSLSLSLCLSMCWLQSKYTPRAQPVSAWFS